MNPSSVFKQRTAVRELILWVGAITVTTLVVLGVSFYLYTTRSMVNALRKQGDATADEVTQVLTSSLYSIDDKAAASNARVYVTSGRLSGIRLVSSVSGVLVDDLPEKASLIPPVERKIVYQDMPLGNVKIIMNDAEIRSAQRTTLMIISLLIGGVLFVYVLLLHSVFKKILYLNLSRIIEGIDRFGKHDFKEKIKPTQYEDLNQLVAGLNAMASSIYEKQQDIIESEERLSLALQAAKSGIWDWNIRTQKVFFCPNYYILAGYEPDEFAHDFEEWRRRVHPDDIGPVEAELASYLKGEIDEFTVEFRFRHKNSHWMWIMSSGRFTGFDGNEPARLTGIHIDSTDRKLAEQNLQNLQGYLSNIIDSMPSVLIGVDRAGCVTQWNSGAEKATGLSSREAAGQSLEKVYPYMAEQMVHVSEAMKTRRVLRDKKRPRPVDGITCYHDVTIYPLVESGVEGAVIRIDDVTEQVQMEEMMVQSEKMLSVGGLAAGMAHEINNPLAGVIQSANVMGRRLTDLDMKANRNAAEEIGIRIDDIRAFMHKRGIMRMISAINRSGKQMATIVDNMLSFARKTDASASSHDPVALVDQILELAATDYDLKKQYDFKMIKIIKEYEDHLPMVVCEGSKIQQVLLNILRNGAQAMQEAVSKGENVDPPCFVLRLSREAEPDMLKIEIADNGPGMEESVRKRVFEPFFTNKPPGSGTGLGLSVSYFIITENLGGSMDVASIPGEGATFTIRLPLDRRSTESGTALRST